MGKTAIIIQARMGSSRLPNKIMIPLAGKPIIQHVIERCRKSKADEIIVATSTNKENDIIEDFCEKINCLCFRGSEDDVLDRYFKVALENRADTIIRVTSDCPLIDSKIIDKLIDEFNSNNYDYLSNVLTRTFPRGLDVEIFSFNTLKKTHELAKRKEDREHVTSFIYANPNIFKIKGIEAQGFLRRPNLRLTIDTNEDLKVLSSIFTNFSDKSDVQISDIINYLDKNPEIRDLNRQSEINQVKNNEEEGIEQKINAEKMPFEIKIGNKKIGGNNPVFIIAELSCNHLQDYDLAVKTIKAMKESGADAVKLQAYTPDTITLDSNQEDFQIKQGTIWDGQTLYKLYKKAYTPWEWIPKLKKLAEDLGLVCFSSSFDKTAVDFLEDLDFPVHKIASFEITDIPLIKYAASKGKPMIISTGIAEIQDIMEAIDVCRSVGNNQIILLKCTSAYPAPYGEVNLRTIPDLEKRFDVIAGLSDHTLGISIPIAAVALGAKIVEKHFILDRNLKNKDGELSPDALFSLEPHEFKSLTDSIRNVEMALGRVNYNLTEKAKKGREFAKSLYVAKDIKKGEIFTEDNVRSVRPGFGLHPKNLDNLIGKTAKTDIKKGTRMDFSLIEEESKN